MNIVVTSKQDILEASRQLIQQQGWKAVNIRSVAAACGVSVGSIYNYYGSKQELVSDTIESIWTEIFHFPNDPSVFSSIESCVSWMYTQMAWGQEHYPNFFTIHSLGFMPSAIDEGKSKMNQAWDHIKLSLCEVMRHDSNIRSDAFNENLTVENFANVLFSLMLSALLKQDYEPNVVLEIVRRMLY